MKAILDYDEIDDWEPWLSDIMLQIASPSLLEQAAASPFEYLSDARKFFIDRLGRDFLVDFLRNQLSSFGVRVFHGTRLGPSDIASLERIGLTPLDLHGRRASLVGPLSKHPRWATVESELDQVFNELGPQNRAGSRENGCVHFCLSRTGLLCGCNHYLYHGAEVDNHVVDRLFGERGPIELLRAARTAIIVSVVLSFEEAMHAANPWGFGGLDFPTVIDRFFSAWAFRLAHPDFSVKAECDSVALRLSRPVPRTEIEEIQTLSDEEVGDLNS